MLSRLSYLFIICALLLSSCVRNDMVYPEAAEVEVRQVPISFVGGHVGNDTRNANNLCAHLTTMGVWGWRNGMWDDNTQIFNNHKISYSPDSAQWEYSPIQYWHKGGHYTFYAYAPHQDQTDAHVSIDSQTHMITINDVTLTGHNLQQTPTASLKEVFANTPDVDWMIDRRGKYATGNLATYVEITMQHILSKLNICVIGDEELMARPHIASITTDSIVVDALPSHGDFCQQFTNAVAPNNNNVNPVGEWTTHSPDIDIKSTKPANITTQHTYLVESLVIPHNTNIQSTITLYYTFRYADGQVEECRYRMPLNEAFACFIPGYNHTITFNICSENVNFVSQTKDWH